MRPRIVVAKMSAVESTRRIYLVPEERPGLGPRRYRLARMEIVALATPPHGEVDRRRVNGGEATDQATEAGP
jgi:hypothetical protein